MFWFNKFIPVSVVNILRAIVIIPIIGVVLYGVYEIYDTFKTYQKLKVDYIKLLDSSVEKDRVIEELNNTQLYNSKKIDKLIARLTNYNYRIVENEKQFNRLTNELYNINNENISKLVTLESNEKNESSVKDDIEFKSENNKEIIKLGKINHNTKVYTRYKTNKPTRNTVKNIHSKKHRYRKAMFKVDVKRYKMVGLRDIVLINKAYSFAINI